MSEEMLRLQAIADRIQELQDAGTWDAAAYAAAMAEAEGLVGQDTYLLEFIANERPDDNS